MIIYFLANKIPDDWKPDDIWLLFGVDLIIEVFILSMFFLAVRFWLA